MRLKNGEVCFRWPLAQHIITAGWLYNGPHDDPLDAGLAIAVLDSAAFEIRELLTETLTVTEVTP